MKGANTIRTASGKYVNVVEPDYNSIRVEDIAHALSQVNRYNGHYPYPLSVAEHSLKVLEKVKKKHPNASPKLKLHALLHDASEAYLLDFPRPIKKEMKGYWGFEQTFMDLIFKKVGIEEADFQKEVEEADAEVFNDEWSLWQNWNSADLTEEKRRSLFKPYYFYKDLFLKTFYELMREKELYK